MYGVTERALDIAVSGILFLVLSPLLVVIWTIVVLLMGQPGLFVQVRPGLHGVPFRLLKFRTMM